MYIISTIDGQRHALCTNSSSVNQFNRFRSSFPSQRAMCASVYIYVCVCVCLSCVHVQRVLGCVCVCVCVCASRRIMSVRRRSEAPLTTLQLGFGFFFLNRPGAPCRGPNRTPGRKCPPLLPNASSIFSMNSLSPPGLLFPLSSHWAFRALFVFTTGTVREREREGVGGLKLTN